MAWLENLGRQIATLLRRKQFDGEMDEEMRLHRELKTQELVQGGMSSDEARDAAHRQFGNALQLREESRQAWGWTWLEQLGQDVRFGSRMLRKNPGFACAAILSLGLGIGANTVLFSMVDSLLLHPLPVKSPEQITVFAFQQKNGSLRSIFSIPDYRDIQDQTQDSFSGVFGYQIGLDGLSVDGKGDRVSTAYVTGNFFSVLGIKPALGRFILPSEGREPGSDPVIVLSDSYWKIRFASDPAIIGKTASVNGHALTIIGVAPPGFNGVNSLVSSQAYLPLGMALIGRYPTNFMINRGSRSLYVFGRLQPGMDLRQAQISIDVAGQRLSQQYPDTDRDIRIEAIPELRSRLGASRKDTVLLVSALFLGLAALVLLLASMNVANILLVRSTIRGREMAIRAALGAGRSRLMRQLLTESLLLALLGGAAGILLAPLGILGISSINLQTAVPFRLDAGFDWRVFSYAFGSALFTGVTVGIFSAIRVSSESLSGALHEGGYGIAGGGNRLRNVLAIAQLSGSLILLVIAGLFTRSLREAQRANLGFEPNHVLNLSMDPNEVDYDSEHTLQFYSNLITRVRALPGVESASTASSVPMSGLNRPEQLLSIEGLQPPAGEPGPSAPVTAISLDYFKTLGITVVAGRTFRAADDKGSPTASIVNEAMAHRFWPRRDPLGQRFSIKGIPNHPFEVVGVVKDFKFQDMTSSIQPHFLVPQAQTGFSFETLQIRTAGDPEVMAPEIERVIGSMAPGLPVFNVQTMTQALDTMGGLLMFRLGAVLAASLGILGLSLATVGVYGVISYVAKQKTREIGIRMALGAQRSDILKIVLRDGLQLALIGTFAGTASALGLTRFLRNLLYGITPTDPITFAGVIALMLGVALLACWIPARRATRIDPAVALRHE